jgi:hypothetical protein
MSTSAEICGATSCDLSVQPVRLVNAGENARVAIAPVGPMVNARLMKHPEELVARPRLRYRSRP